MSLKFNFWISILSFVHLVDFFSLCMSVDACKPNPNISSISWVEFICCCLRHEIFFYRTYSLMTWILYFVNLSRCKTFTFFFCFSSFLTIQPLESIVWLNLLLVFCIVSVCVCSFANLLSSAFYSDDHHHDHGHGWFVSTFVDGRSVGWLVVRNIWLVFIQWFVLMLVKKSYRSLAANWSGLNFIRSLMTHTRTQNRLYVDTPGPHFSKKNSHCNSVCWK